MSDLCMPPETGTYVSSANETNKSKKPRSLSRAGKRALEWQVQPGQDTDPLVAAVVTGLERLREAAPAFECGAARAACVKGGAGTTMLIILAFGDDVFAQVGALMQSLGLANELPAEDPETGLDAVFVPVRRAAPEE